MSSEGHSVLLIARKRWKRRICWLSCIGLAASWSILLWWDLLRLHDSSTSPLFLGDSPVKVKASEDLQGEKKNSRRPCDSFLSNVTTSRFYPQRFFQHGAGKPFLPIYERNRNAPGNILNARFLVFETGKPPESCTIVHHHIHKNGGTTLERHVPLPTENYFSKREKDMGRESFEAACAKVMENVWHGQQQVDRQASRTFTFLRDPIPRFLSSVAQVLKLRIWHTRLYPCHERNDTEALLDCVLDMLETHNFPEMHLAPQSFELYKQVMGKDIFIEVLDLSQIGQVMEELGAGKISKERSTTGSFIRRFPNFRLTMDALNDSRIRRICKVYDVDVQMLEQTNVTKTICSTLEDE